MQISYHSTLTKIQKLQKKKKKLFFWTGRYDQYQPILFKIGRYGWYMADTAGIFSSTNQGGYMYRFACRYGIYQPVQYRIDTLAKLTLI